MAITTLANLRTATKAQQRQPFYKVGAGSVNARFGAIFDQWWSAGLPSAGSTGSVGNAGVTLDRTSAGALPLTPAGSGHSLYLLSAFFQTLWDSRSTAMAIPMTGGIIHVWDRLWYNDSLISNTIARRSWSPPALTRYTTGEGLSIWYKQTTGGTGSGVVTYTLEYTNSDNVAQTSTYTWDHGGLSQIGLQNQMVAVPLVTGDKGVRAVTAVTQSATIVTGAYGFMIQKYIGAFPVDLQESFPSPTSIMNGLPAIHNDAHLVFGIQMGPPYNNSTFIASTVPTLGGELIFVEG